MANLTDYTYFQKGPVLIPNLGTTPAPFAARVAELNVYIARYEKEFLRMYLGDDLYDAFIAGPTATRFVALKAQLIDATNLRSPIANYVYINYQQDHQQITTASGDKATETPAMTTLVNQQKYVNIINDMQTMCDDLYDWLTDNSTTYPEWECDWNFDKVHLFGI